MDQQRFTPDYLLQHRHHDGEWAAMEEVRSHHDAAQHDQERSWGLRRIFKCRTCDEMATIVPGAEGDVTDYR